MSMPIGVHIVRAHPRTATVGTIGRTAAAAVVAVVAVVALVGALLVVIVSPARSASADSAAASPSVSYTIDGNQADANPADAWKGFGAVTCNNTSRYLLDYKDEHPQQYWRIMNELFNPVSGLGLTQVKIELGSDGNTSSGAEPATMRTSADIANVLRGAGFHFAADAKSINPNVQVSLLNWSRPAWVKTADDRYTWYKDTIDAAYDTYGLVVDWVDPNTNETSTDVAWTTEFAQRLKSETDARYDYSKIKIAIDDSTGSNSTNMANNILSLVNPNSVTAAQKAAARTPSSDPATAVAQATDPANAGVLWSVSYPQYDDGVAAYYYRVANQTLMGLVSALAHHYDVYTGPAMAILNRTYGMQIWYSEGVAGIGTGEGTQHLGLQSGSQTAIDVANLFINSYSSDGNSTIASNGYPTDVKNAHHTLYMFQPAVEAYPQGTTYSSKSDITALNPWSGNFDNELGYYVTRQFTAFASTGSTDGGVNVPGVEPTGAWQYVEGGASHGSGSESGNGIVGSDSGYLTLENPQHTQFSTVLTNNSSHAVDYSVTVKNVSLGATSRLATYETDYTDGTTFDSKWFQRGNDIPIPTPQADGSFVFTFTMAPYSVKTISSLPDSDLPASHSAGDNTGAENIGRLDYRTGRQQATIYQDDFEYAPGSLGYSANYEPAATAWNYSVCKAVNTDPTTNACAPAGQKLSYLDRRGNTPRYSNDMNGAFEVNQVGDGHALVQQLTYDQIPGAWNPGPPETLIGDDKWANYTASADIHFDTATAANPSYQNYVGIGGRASAQGNGFLLLVQSNGDWGILQNPGDAGSVGNGQITAANSLAHGFIPGFDPSVTHKLALTMKGMTVVADVDGTQLASWTDADGANVAMAGRLNLVSGWYRNAFDNVTVSAVPGYVGMLNQYVDDGDDAVAFSGTWSHDFSGSNTLDRTQSVASAGASFTVPFTGTGFQLQGNGTQTSHITVAVDGRTVATDVEESTSSARAVGYYLTGLSDTAHTLTVTSVDGGLSIDDIGIYGQVSPGSDKHPLQRLVTSDGARHLKSTDYSPSSWSVYSAALSGADAVLRNRFSDQDAFDRATSALDTAFSGLQAVALESIKDTYVTTSVGVAPALPATVVPTYGTGVGGALPVVWDTAGASWTSPGTVVVFGHGTDANGEPFATAKAIVTVADISLVDPVSVTVLAGTTAAALGEQLPSTVKGQVGQTTQRNDVPVTWNTAGITDGDLAQPGTLTVAGTATTDAGTTIPATATVIVTQELIASICPQDAGATVTATYSQSGSSPSATCDGSTASSPAWSDWVSGHRTADSLTYTFTHTYTVNSVTVYSTESAASSYTVQYQNADGQWVDSGAGTITGLSVGAPSTASFAPVTTQAVRVNFAFAPAGYTKISEVLISGVTTQPNVASICPQDPGATVTATYTESGYAAAATCDGSTGSTTRWSDWVSGDRSADALTYTFTHPYTVSSVSVYSSESAASSYTVQYQNADGQWVDTDAGAITGLSLTAPSTATFTPVLTRAIRVNFAFSPVGYTKINEVVIMGSSRLPSGIDTLGELEADNVGIAGFSPSVTSYTVPVSSLTTLPTVTALPTDAGATVAITQPGAAQPIATITVTAGNGSTKTYTVDFTTDQQPKYVYYIDSGAAQSDTYSQVAAGNALLNKVPDQQYIPASTSWGYDTADSGVEAGSPSDPNSSYRATYNYYLTLNPGTYQITVGYNPLRELTALSTVYDDSGAALAPTVSTAISAGEYPTATSTITLTQAETVALNTVPAGGPYNPRIAWVAVIETPQPPSVTSISVVPPPTTRFAVGQPVLLTGLKVVVTFADGSKADVTAKASIAPLRDLQTPGPKPLTISYTAAGDTVTTQLTIMVLGKG